MEKKAVLLLNLGSPDSTSVKDVRRYLREFLWDERVLDAPAPIRWFVLNAFILPFRPKRSAEAYASIWTPDGSPLMVISRDLQKAVQADTAVPVELAMRYGTPSIPEIVGALAAQGVNRVLLVPLYPHYAMSSYETVVVRAREELVRQLPEAKVDCLQPFYQDEDYIEALYASAEPWLKKPFDQLLFSFHGIPERHLRKSDPSHAHCLTVKDCCQVACPAHATCYRHQCFQTVEAFAKRAGLNADQYQVSFQSRLGRDPWLKPYTDYRLEALPGEGVKRLLVICPAFVSDCLETLEEIAEEGKEIFMEAGGEFYEQIPCLNTHPGWLAFLNGRIGQWLQ